MNDENISISNQNLYKLVEGLFDFVDGLEKWPEQHIAEAFYSIGHSRMNDDVIRDALDEALADDFAKSLSSKEINEIQEYFSGKN